MNRTLRRAAAAVTALALLASSGALFAQERSADPGVIDEIVVTARKRAEDLRDVPLSITAFSSEQLERRNIESLADVAAATPGLTYFETLNGTLGTPVIRGLTQVNLSSPDRNVAIFYGGIYLSNSNASNLDILDLERIEVVKGPQSALYGRNAFGGAINAFPPVRARTSPRAPKGRWAATIATRFAERSPAG
jgi:iron complex outermembrane receptor protein